MPYCTNNDIIAEINGADLIAFTDDSNSGSLDQGVLDAIIARESAKIDGRLSPIYNVPFNPVPQAIRDACTLFVCEALYRRRLTPDEKNPFKVEADEMRERLKMIGSNEMNLDLDVTVPRAFAQGAFQSVPLGMNGNSL